MSTENEVKVFEAKVVEPKVVTPKLEEEVNSHWYVNVANAVAKKSDERKAKKLKKLQAEVNGEKPEPTKGKGKLAAVVGVGTALLGGLAYVAIKNGGSGADEIEGSDDYSGIESHDDGDYALPDTEDEISYEIDEMEEV